MSLINYGEFPLHSGEISNFKVDCDVLVWNDLNSIVQLALQVLPPFGKVIGIPTGGNRLAAIFHPYTTRYCNRILIIDDVLTSGGSMEEKKQELERCGETDIVGFVIINRGKCPDWIISLLDLNPKFRDL